MIDIKCIKNKLNLLNAVVTGIILLFIVIRVLSNNHENAFIIESIDSTEMQIEASEVVTQIQLETTTISEKQATDLPISVVEPLAYSAELGKTFTLEAFNKLSKEELMTFSGIGEVTAQAILDYRKENGPFSDFNDLMLVKGIGEKKLQKIMTILP